MSFPDLRSFLRHLEAAGQLARVRCEVDPDQEVTIIQHRVLAAGGPALLFERVKGSPYRLVTNLFGTPGRVAAAFGRPPGEISQQLVDLASGLMPPSLGALWSARRDIRRLLRARLKTVARGPVLETSFAPPQLDRLPCLTCWPLDGGPFFTLPLVHTVDPVSGVGNLGIYRLQRFDAGSTGMHWQIEKGGGFHFQNACRLGRPLPVSVFLGGPPALTLAAITPLPEGLDERLLAALIMGEPLEVILRQSGHRIPAQAEFVLEGSVAPGDMRQEGPFGDHLGHYSHSAQFPVFRVERLLARQDAIFPATVVGKPPQEDYYIGEALQELTLPLLKFTKPAVADLWAYPETGFHPLAVASVRERYPHEALKHALGLLGEGQLSLTKVLILVPAGVNVRDFAAVSNALWANLDPSSGLHLLAPTAQDTLDFTGPALNTGSRLILLALPSPSSPPSPPSSSSPSHSTACGLASSSSPAPFRTLPPSPPPRGPAVHPDIRALAPLGRAFLIAQLHDNADLPAVRNALAVHPLTGNYLFHVLVSADVPVDDPRLILWGWFTRFDPLADLHPFALERAGNRLIFQFPIAIDATWKPGYRLPVAFDPDLERKVLARWGRYEIPRSGAPQ